MTSYSNWQKYANCNPLQRMLIARFLRKIARLSRPLGAKSIFDAGCAEGFVVRAIRRNANINAQYFGVDIDSKALKRSIRVSGFMHPVCGNISDLPFTDDQFDLVLCNEVLEHLSNPIVAIREISRISRRHVIFSVPHEPWFHLLNLLRGRNILHLGNDPEHIQRWNRKTFDEVMSREFDIIQSTSAFPWLIVLAQKRSINRQGTEIECRGRPTPSF